MERGAAGGRGGGWRPGPRSSEAERTAERVPGVEGLLADRVQDSGPAPESGRRLRDVGSEAGEVGLAAAAPGCLRHQGQRWPRAGRAQEAGLGSLGRGG